MYSLGILGFKKDFLRAMKACTCMKNFKPEQSKDDIKKMKMELGNVLKGHTFALPLLMATLEGNESDDQQLSKS